MDNGHDVLYIRHLFSETIVFFSVLCSLLLVFISVLCLSSSNKVFGAIHRPIFSCMTGV